MFRLSVDRSTSGIPSTNYCAVFTVIANFFFFSQVLQKLFAFGFDNANQELYQTIAVSL